MVVVPNSNLNQYIIIIIYIYIFRDLNHKNVITYYGSIVKQCTRRGQPVLEWGLVMEYCSRTLSDVLIDGDFCNPCKLSPDDPSLGTSYETIAMYALQICEALTYLHGKSLVHRDLKLANILVSTLLFELGPKLDLYI